MTPSTMNAAPLPVREIPRAVATLRTAERPVPSVIEGKNHTVAWSGVVGSWRTVPGPVSLPCPPSDVRRMRGRRTKVAPTANTPAIT